MADIGEFVTRKGIYPPLPDANKIQLVDMIDMDKEAFTQKMAEYKKIFLAELSLQKGSSSSTRSSRSSRWREPCSKVNGM